MITCEYCLRDLEEHDEAKPINTDDSFNHECPELLAALELKDVEDLEAERELDAVMAAEILADEALERSGMEDEDPSLRGEGPDLDEPGDTQPSIVVLGYDKDAPIVDLKSNPFRLFHEAEVGGQLARLADQAGKPRRTMMEFDVAAAERGLVPDTATAEQLDRLGELAGVKRDGSDEP